MESPIYSQLVRSTGFETGIWSGRERGQSYETEPLPMNPAGVTENQLVDVGKNLHTFGDQKCQKCFVQK